MSSWQEFSGGRRLGNTPPVKCSVAQTCNRLSRYLRERGSLRDLGPEIAGKLEVKGTPEASHLTPPPPNFLFGRMDNPTEESAKQGLMDLFPQHADAAGVNTTRELDATDKALSSKQTTMEIEPKTAAMTIFYGDQVFVFDNFPADKVGDLIRLTNGENSVPKPHSKAFGSDLPIARRASLHRFMDKRKDRVIARAPYPVHGSPSASSTKQEEQLALKL